MYSFRLNEGKLYRIPSALGATDVPAPSTSAGETDYQIPFDPSTVLKTHDELRQFYKLDHQDVQRVREYRGSKRFFKKEVQNDGLVDITCKRPRAFSYLQEPNIFKGIRIQNITMYFLGSEPFEENHPQSFADASYHLSIAIRPIDRPFLLFIGDGYMDNMLSSDLSVSKFETIKADFQARVFKESDPTIFNFCF